MKKILSMLLMSLIVMAGYSQNLLKNGSFEEWAEGDPLPKYWSTHSRKDITEKLSRETEIVRDGKISAKYKNASMGHMLFQSVPVKEGEFYDISFQTKTNIGMYEVRLMYYWLSADNKRIPNVNENKTAPSATGVNDWMTIAHKNMQAPPGAVRLMINVVPNDAWSKRTVPGEFWVDDVRIEKSKVETVDKNYLPLSSVPVLDKVAITLDGKLDEAVWQRGSVITNLATPIMYSPEVAQTRCIMLADSEYLYIGAKMFRNAASAKGPEKAHERDKGSMSDQFELFFKPEPTMVEQFHFMFDPAGSIWDSKQVFHDGKIPVGEYLNTRNDNSWNAGKLEIVTAEQEDGWSLECRIPYSDLGCKAPKLEAIWKANVCRGDYGQSGTTHNQLSSWGLLKLIQFADNNFWGDLVFRKNPVAVHDVKIQTMTNNVAVSLWAPADAKAEIVIEHLNDTGSVIELGRQAVELKKDKEEFVIVPLNAQTDVYWVSVYGDGKLMFRSGGRAMGKIIALGTRDVLNVRKNQLYVANDTFSYNGFMFRHTLQGGGPNKVFGNPSELDVKIIAEVPEGVEIPYLVYSNWGGDNEASKPLKEEVIERNSGKYTRYTLRGNISKVNSPLIFFRAKLKEGYKGKMYLYAVWKDGSQAPVEYDFEVVKFGRHKPFERMQLRLDDLTPRFAALMSENPVAELPTMGINVFKIPMNPSKIKLYYKETKETAAQLYDRLYNEMKNSPNKWFFSVQNELNGVLRYWGNEIKSGNKLNLVPDEKALFRDIDGKPVRNQFGWNSVCPMYRGINYQKELDYIAECEAVSKYGVRWFVLDWEIFPDFKQQCFCDNCVDRLWPEYCREHKIAVSNPREFMKDPKQNPELFKAWKEFYESNRGQMYVDLKNDLARRTKEKTGEDTRFYLSEWTGPIKHLMKGIDYFDWAYAYRDPQTRYELVDEVFTNVAKGSSKQIVASVNNMQGCELNRQYAPISLYYNMFESASLGVRGFEWWYCPTFNTMDFKFIMDGLRTIRPYEDLILDGTVTVAIKGENCTARRVSLDDESLYCVRNYLLKEKGKAILEFEVKTASELHDAATGEKLADLKTGKNQVTIELSPEGNKLARLLYLGPAGKFAARQKAAEIK